MISRGVEEKVSFQDQPCKYCLKLCGVKILWRINFKKLPKTGKWFLKLSGDPECCFHISSYENKNAG